MGLTNNFNWATGGSSIAGAALSLIPYTKNMTDVSATGMEIDFETKYLSGSGETIKFTISKFADDKRPLQIDDATVSEGDPSFKGGIVFGMTIPRVIVTVSVIPNTKDDANIGAIFSKYVHGDEQFTVNMTVRQTRVDPNSASDFAVLGFGAGNLKSYGMCFMNGIPLKGTPSGDKGLPQGSAESSGRYSGHSYSFLFTSFAPIENKAATSGFNSALPTVATTIATAGAGAVIRM